jgi:hypothetical protein
MMRKQEMTEDKKRLMRARDEFLRLVSIEEDRGIIYAHLPKVITGLACLIARMSERKLTPVRMYVQTIDECGTPIHQLTVELANYDQD